MIAIATAGCVPTLSQPRGAAERRVDRDEAEWRQAQAYRRLRRLDEALALFDAIAARRPISRRTVRARFAAARMRLDREGEAHERALAELRAICFEHPDDGPASRALTLLLAELRRNGDPSGAIALLEALDREVAHTDLGDDVLTHLAAIRLESGDRAAARALYERIVDEHPYPHGQRWDDALWRLADLAEEDGDPRAAIAYLERMIAPHGLGLPPGSYTLPRMPEAGIRIARLHRDALGDAEGAIQAYRRFHDGFPTSLLRDDALLEMGELQLATGARRDGCATLHRLLDEFEVGTAVRRARERVVEACP